MKSVDQKNRIQEIEAFALQNRCPLGPGPMKTQMLMRIRLSVHRPGRPGEYQQNLSGCKVALRSIPYTEGRICCCFCGKAASLTPALNRIGA